MKRTDTPGRKPTKKERQAFRALGRMIAALPDKELKQFTRRLKNGK